MRILTAHQMLTEDLILQDVLINSVHEPKGFSSSFQEKPRDTSVLFLYNAGCREYFVADDRDFPLRPGDILYIPIGARYIFRITDTGEQPQDYGIAINFRLRDKSGEDVCLTDAPRVIHRDRLAHYFTLFSRIEAAGRDRINNGMLVKSLVYALLYEIFSELQLSEVMKQPWHVILPAIRLTEADPAQDIPVPGLAQLCGVSETRFRRLWNEYTGGISPVDYRNRLRIDLAEKLIRTEHITVENAAYQSGFRDIPHFYRMFRKFKGTAPLERE